MLRRLVYVAGLLLAMAPAAHAQLIERDHPGQYDQQDIARGSLLYNGQCTQCHGRDGDQISGIDLRRGTFRRAVSDDDVARAITTGTPGGMPPFRLQPDELTGIVAFIRSGFDTTANVRLGDAARGQAVFDGKGECRACHRVQGSGPRLAPDLSEIGATRTPAALERSIRDPSSAMLPINRPVRIVTRDGKVVQGRRLNEDTQTVQLIDEHERLLSLSKKDLRTFEIGMKSTMPSYGGRFSDEEIADVVSYLLTLRIP
jgi:cytochrome c oxidase cbb3-type subunit III